MWDPTRISTEAVDYYLKQMDKLWPYEQCHFQEDLALYYLHKKNYDVEEALKSVILDIDELI